MTSVPEPPWLRRKKRPAPVKRTLTRDAIVEAAMRIVDAEGVDALSMRRVAQALDTGAASLYAHVENKDELLALLLDKAQEGMTVPVPDPGRWQEQIKDVVREGRRRLAVHRDLARAAGEVPLGPNQMIVAEGMLGILRAAGLPPQVCAYGVDAIALYLVAVVVDDAGRDLRIEAADEKERAVRRAEFTGRIRDYFAALPADDFPNTRALAAELTRDVGDERFEFGLDLLLRGLERHAEG